MTEEEKQRLDYPKLRHIDAAPAMSDERNLMMLYDPSRITDRVMLVTQDILYILQFFDGNHSQLDIRAEYMRKFGTFLYEDRLKKIVEDLDKHLLLENERFFQYRAALVETYRKESYRNSILAGESYEADSERLREELKHYFLHSEGPGLPDSSQHNSQVHGIIAPHIDVRSGGHCYAHVYKWLAESEPNDLFVILGTCHSSTSEYFTATEKDFQTPLGVIHTDRKFILSVQEKWTADLFQDEIMHKVEHTIEFQVIFLQYLFAAQCRIVPILCSFSFEDLKKEDHKILDFFNSLKKTIAEYSGKVCVISSVDFSHVGPRYGDAFVPEANLQSLIRRHDLELLDLAFNHDADGFVQAISISQNKYRVCGLAPIYTMLNVIDFKKGQLLKYDSSRVDEIGSIVTYASAVFSADN